MPTETALVALATFFATIGPVDVAAIFAAITPDNTGAEKRAMALKGTLIATGILLVIAFFGEFLLSRMGITLQATRRPATRRQKPRSRMMSRSFLSRPP